MIEQLAVNEVAETDIDGLDAAEEASGGTGLVKPWDPGKIRITTKTFSLREVVEQIEEKDIDLSPDFQRDYVWKARQQTRLIESILLGIPLPAFYFNQSETGTYQVVDGVQRLTTIANFMRGKHRLTATDLEYLTNLNGRNYHDLDTPDLRRFRSAQIVVHVIEPQTPDEVKYDIFNRVNTLGSPLSPQEIRHAMSGARARNFLSRLAESDAFDRATEKRYWKIGSSGNPERDSSRMANRELVLRFCAFRMSSLEEYRSFPSLDAFLMHFMRRIDGSEAAVVSDQDLDRLAADFEQAMISAHHVLGVFAFRRSASGADRRGPINRAVFEAQANALADYPPAVLQPHAAKILSAFRSAFQEPDYLRSVTVSTGDANRVSYRLRRTKQILAGALA